MQCAFSPGSLLPGALLKLFWLVIMICKGVVIACNNVTQ